MKHKNKIKKMILIPTALLTVGTSAYYVGENIKNVSNAESTQGVGGTTLNRLIPPAGGEFINLGDNNLSWVTDSPDKLNYEFRTHQEEDTENSLKNVNILYIFDSSSSRRDKAEQTYKDITEKFLNNFGEKYPNSSIYFYNYDDSYYNFSNIPNTHSGAWGRKIREVLGPRIFGRDNSMYSDFVWANGGYNAMYGNTGGVAGPGYAYMSDIISMANLSKKINPDRDILVIMESDFTDIVGSPPGKTRMQLWALGANVLETIEREQPEAELLENTDTSRNYQLDRTFKRANFYKNNPGARFKFLAIADGLPNKTFERLSIPQRGIYPAETLDNFYMIGTEHVNRDEAITKFASTVKKSYRTVIDSTKYELNLEGTDYEFTEEALNKFRGFGGTKPWFTVTGTQKVILNLENVGQSGYDFNFESFGIKIKDGANVDGKKQFLTINKDGVESKVLLAKPKTTITEQPYQTRYVADDTKEVGFRSESGGTPGSTKVITTYSINPQSGEVVENNSTPEVIPPTEKIVTIGTKPKTTITEQPYQTKYVGDDTQEVGYKSESDGTVGVTKTTTTYSVNPQSGEITETNGDPEITQPVEKIITLGTKPKVTITEQPFETKYVADDTKELGFKSEEGGIVGTTTITTTYSVNPDTGKITETPGDPVVVVPVDKIITVGTNPKTTTTEQPYETKYVTDDTKEVGFKSESGGTKGTTTVTTTYSVDPKTGEITEKQSTPIVTPPVDKIITEGAKKQEVTPKPIPQTGIAGINKNILASVGLFISSIILGITGYFYNKKRKER